MVQLRRANARWARSRREAIDAGSRGAVISLQLRGLCVDLLRGAVLTAVAYTALAPVVDAALAHWFTPPHFSHAVVAAVAASVTAGAAWKLFHSVQGARWCFLGGLAAGLLLLLAQ